jgi:hypothetical protein
LLTEVRDVAGVLALPTLGCTLELAEIYAQVEFSVVDLRERTQASR